MPVNVLMCRWIGGWREVRNEASIATYGRREAMLSLGALQSPQEVDRVAGQQLEIFANPRTAIAADLEPMSTADRPYRAWNVGDTITVPDYGGGTIAQRVRSLTGSEDDNGEITYSPELGDLILEAQERHEQAIKKMADGTLDGESPIATPVAQTQQVQKVYGGAPFPAASTLKYQSTKPWNPYDSSSQSDRSGAYRTATLVSFRVTPSMSGPNDGTTTVFEMWQAQGGDGDFALATVDIGTTFQGGTTYTGTIYQPQVRFGDNVYGIWFEVHEGNPTGPAYVEAIFSDAGQTYTLDWYQQA